MKEMAAFLSCGCKLNNLANLSYRRLREPVLLKRQIAQPFESFNTRSANFFVENLFTELENRER